MDLNQIYQIFRSCTGGVTTDSRHCPKGSLFIALRGEKFDGNAYAARALEAGSAYAVVDRQEVIPHDGDERYLLTDNSLHTLQALARLHRRTLGTPMLAITGTNGKTTTKELVSIVLARRYCVLHTEGNLNNHIGVPLTLLRLRPEHQVAVVEMGASHPGDICELVDIAEPDMGLITNVGRAHLLGFGSIEGVARTKGELFNYLRKHGRGPAFVCCDDERVRSLAQGLRQLCYGSGVLPAEAQPSAIGKSTRAACYVTGHPVGSRSPYLSLVWQCAPSCLSEGIEQDPRARVAASFNSLAACENRFACEVTSNGQTPEDPTAPCASREIACEPIVEGQAHEVHTHLIGDYNLPNVLAAAAVGSYLGVPANQINLALEAYTPSNNRSQLVSTANNTLVVDAYNANPTSMHASITNFLRLSAPRPLLILGDMRELGPESLHEHQCIVDELVAQGLTPSSFQVVTCGKAEPEAENPDSNSKAACRPLASTGSDFSQATVVLVGPEFAATHHPFLSFPDVAALIAALQAHKPTGRTILIKGSNGVRLSSIVEYL